MSAVIAAPAASAAGWRPKIGWLPYLLIAPTMLALVVVSLLPFLYAVWLSFHDISFGQVGELNSFGNYTKLLGNDRLWNALWVATKFTLLAVPVEFVLGLAGALVLNQRIRGRSILLPLLFIPSMMAPIVVGLLWKIMLAGSWGLLSYKCWSASAGLRALRCLHRRTMRCSRSRSWTCGSGRRSWRSLSSRGSRGFRSDPIARPRWTVRAACSNSSGSPCHC